MDNKEKKLLQDIFNCISNIENYMFSKDKFEIYNNDLMLQDAVERNLITIGEALNSLLKINSEIPISNCRRIVDTRNKLTHGYDEIENVMIWSILMIHLPVLKKEVLLMLT
jgi:uncharacterized protein with HEPN domain